VKIAQKWVLQSQQDSAFVEHQLCPAQLDDIFSDRVLQSVYIVGGHLPDYSHFTESSTTHNLQKFVVVEIIERRTAVNGAGVAGEHHGIGYVGRGHLGFLGRRLGKKRLSSSACFLGVFVRKSSLSLSHGGCGFGRWCEGVRGGRWPSYRGRW
jgi:hypothetical protein